VPVNLRLWVLSGQNSEVADFTRESTVHEVLWINRNLTVSTTHEIAIGNILRLPRLTFEGRRFVIADQVQSLLADLVLWSNNPGAQDGTLYVVQHTLPTYVEHPTTGDLILTWVLSLSYSLMELTPQFNGSEMTVPVGFMMGYLRRLIDNMPANRLSESYTGPRPTRFERILEND